MTAYRPYDHIFQDLGRTLQEKLQLQPGPKHREYDLNCPLTEAYGRESVGEEVGLLEVGVRAPEMNYAIFKTIIHCSSANLTASGYLQPGVGTQLLFELGRQLGCEEAWGEFAQEALAIGHDTIVVGDRKVTVPQAGTAHMQEIKELTTIAFVRLILETVKIQKL